MTSCGMKVAFDVLTEAIFEHETDRRHDKYDEVSNWFKISIADWRSLKTLVMKHRNFHTRKAT